MSAASPVTIERHDAVLRVRMVNPAKRNALCAEMKTALHAAARELTDDAALRCLVLTGSDGVFCAGGDLSNMAEQRRPTAVRQRMASTHGVLRALTACEKLVVMAVNGAAVGAGLSLALAGDVIVASESAYFMGGFARVGVLPDMGILYHLPRAVGMPRAKDILLTNPRLGAAQALAMGLVSRVLPDAGFDDALLELATQLADGPGVSLALTKALMNRAHGTSLDDFLLHEGLAQATVFGTDDFAEGTAAFLAKRAPRFTGR